MGKAKPPSSLLAPARQVIPGSSADKPPSPNLMKRALRIVEVVKEVSHPDSTLIAYLC